MSEVAHKVSGKVLCFRAERDRRRPQALAETRVPGLLSGRLEPRTLTQHATEHRRRMLEHLEAVRAVR